MGGLGLRGKGDSALLESIDSKAMVRNLCASQKWHPMDFFLTFTCNMKKHFGTKPIKEWLDSEDWKKFFPGYNDLDDKEKFEIDESVIQSSSSLILRVWQEVCQLFLSYLRKSTSSPYRRVLSIFARNEYQAKAGNVSHIHLMLEVCWQKMNDEEKSFVHDLTRCSVLDIVRPNEVQRYIDEGVFKSIDDWKDTIVSARKHVGHICDSRCLARIEDGKVRCRKINYLKASRDNTKHTFMKLPDDLPKDCLLRLEQIGMIETFTGTVDSGCRHTFKSKLSFLHPSRHLPPTNPSDDINMSPVEGYTFSICQSMQNIQVLTQTGGVNKYVCKYIGKIDEQNYVVVKVDDKSTGSLMTKATFLHNTKVSSSKINEDKLREKKYESKYPQGRCISHMEMLHVMLKYPEVITNLSFVTIQTMPLEFRSGMGLDQTVIQPSPDGAQSGSVSDDIRKAKMLDDWRQHTVNDLRIYEDLKLSKASVDKITIFSLRPPEFRVIFNKPGLYFRWFSISKKKIKGDDMNEKITDSLFTSLWIDCFNHQVFVRRKALNEIMSYFDTLDLEGDDVP